METQSPLPNKGAEPPNFRPMFIVSCHTRVKRLYACTQIHYLCFSNYRIPVKYSGESRDVTDIICAKNTLQYLQSHRHRNIFYEHRSLSQKRLKPSLGNSNLHRRRNLDREWSALEIVFYRARIKYACARIHCTCFTYYQIWQNPVHGIPRRLYQCFLVRCYILVLVFI